MSDPEARRQQALLAALAAARPGAVAGLRPLPGPSGQAPAQAGLQAYRRNAMATAWRALAAAYPTLQQLLGDEALRALARDLWQRHPPQRGDLAWFGAELPQHLAGLGDYAHLPWLGDLARLDWAVHRAGFAADAAPEVQGLALLGEHEPRQLGLVWAPGCTWLPSPWPLQALWQALWQAHQGADEAERARGWALARQALQHGLASEPQDQPPQQPQGRPHGVWVQRHGWAVAVVGEENAGAAALNTRLWQGASLGEALEAVLAAAPAGFSFEAWLVQTLQAGRLAAVCLIPAA